MKAVVFHDVGDIRVDDVPEPKIRDDNDAIVRLTASAICGTDLHFTRGTMGPMKAGTVLGHEGVGVVEAVGKGVRNLRVGDRVVIPSTIACGNCSYCRAGWYSKCDKANPKGPEATAFYGGPEMTGPFDGLQAEFARVPFANVGLVKLPESVSDEDAILLSDIWPTAYFGIDILDVDPGNTVAVYGCGPVGQFAIAAALKMGAGRVFAVDSVESRLEMARAQGAEVIDFEDEDPIEILKELTMGIGPDRVLDAVGVDAKPDSSQALNWAVESVAKGGIVSIIGVYPPTQMQFPIGKTMGKNLTIRSGDCPHRRYLPHAVRKVAAGELAPSKILTQRACIADALDAYASFDRHEDGWIKVELLPQGDGSPRSTRGAVGVKTAVKVT